MIYQTIEIIAIIFFVIVCLDALIHYEKKWKVVLLVLAIVYVLIVENITTIITEGQIGSALYNQGFKLLWKTPLFIITLWTSLVYLAMHLSDMLRISKLKKPFMDSLLVTSIFLVFGPVFVRLNLLFWRGYSLYDGWFGIPIAVLSASLFSTFAFSFFFRYCSEKRGEMITEANRIVFYLLLPIFAYLFTMIMFSIVNLTRDTLEITKAQEIFMLLMIVVFFALMINETDETQKPLFYSGKFTVFSILAVRLFIYLFSICLFILAKVYKINCSLAVIITLSVVAELLIYKSAFKKFEKYKRTELEDY